MGLRAPYMLRQNVTDLLIARKEDQVTLAKALGHDKSWANKFLNGHRSIPLKELDQIADFFGLATYQLLQPGISRLTERRSGSDRRKGRERRIGHVARQTQQLGEEIARAHPRQAPPSPPPDVDLDHIVEVLHGLMGAVSDLAERVRKLKEGTNKPTDTHKRKKGA